MKKTLMAIVILAAASFTGTGLSAQEKDNDAGYDQFNGHWFIGVQGGIGQTPGETTFGELISPAASVSFGYQFTPVWGLRAGIGGWQAKGAVVHATTTVYKYNYLQGSVDVMVDLCGIAGYKVSRAVNPYIFAGVGVNGAFNNNEMQNLAPMLPEDNLLWDGSKVLPVGRFGLGMGVRITDAVHFNIEVNGNFMGDSFNSKKGSSVDWQLGAMAGFTFKIGLKKNKKAEPEPVLYEEAVVEKTVDTVSPVTPVDTTEVLPAQEKAAESSLTADAYEAADFEAVEENIFFTIGMSTLRDSEVVKLNGLVSLLNANLQTSVTVTGYADKGTGSAERNMQLSKERAENVAAALVNAGVSANRITVRYKGSEENPFDTPEQNRVAICIVDDDK